MTAATASTGSTGSTGGASRGRNLWLWLVIAAGLVVVALVAGGPSTSKPDLDPSSTSAHGTKALTELLAQSGAQVDVSDSTPGPSTDVAVLLVDTPTAAMTDELERWVEQGGTLVVADPDSSFAPGVASSTQSFGLVSASLPPGNCQIDALRQVDRVRPSQDGAYYDTPEASRGCFTDDQGNAFVVDRPTGRGHVVAVGSPSVFTNDSLGEYDNAVLAVDLMAPREGTQVTGRWGMTGGASSEGNVTDLISVGVKLAFLQLVVAFVVYSWWRARRLGPPVLEPQPVQIAGSELVAAVGNLLQQTHDPDRAARLLRSDLRRRLCERLGLPPGASAEVIADVTAGRSGVDRDRVARAITDMPVRSEDELLDLARDIDIIRTEVLHGTAP